MIDQMSLESYRVLDASSQSKVILEVIRANDGILSSRDLSNLTKIDRTSVTARLRYLEGKGLIIKEGLKDDPITGKRVNTYAAVKA